MGKFLIGRQKQIGALQEAYTSSRPKMVAFVGPRRVGMTRQEIIKAGKFSNGGMLSEVLDELEKSGFITDYGGYGKKIKDCLYRLSDFYSLFYLTFIESLGKSSRTDFTQLSDLPKWKTWIGYAYENLCLTHVDQIRKALGIP